MNPVERLNVSVPLLLAGLMVVLLGVWSQAAPSAAFAEGAAQMSLSASGDDVDCSGGVCTVGAGATFTLSVNADEVPAEGYVLVQSFIDFGPNLSYTPTADVEDEVIWPDCEPAVAVRAQFTPETVNHGCLTSLIPPLTFSTYVGPVFEIQLTCTDDFSSSDVQLLPYDDELAITSGALFAIADGEGVDPKLSPLTVSCGAATPGGPVEGLPPTGNGPLGAGDSGMSSGLWLMIGMLAAAGIAGVGAASWRAARGRISQ